MAKSQLPARNRIQITLLASAISAALTGAAYTTVARAQDAPENLEDEVVVTGSRIVRRDLDAPTPIMTVDTERLENSSTLSVETVLNQMPQFTPAQSQFSAQGEIVTTPSASLGIGTVNLRGIGTNRTLVLIDGRRAQPANSALVVDLNTIPSAAISRVETITGGASAVYGADAIAGVVNFVLKDDFEGVSLDLQTGMTEAGDGEETRASSFIGLNSESGRANVLLGVEWYERRVSFQKNRDFYVDGWDDKTNVQTTSFPSMPGYAINAANRPTQAAVDALFANTAGYVPGMVNVNAATPPTIYFNRDGSPWANLTSGPTIGAIGFNDSQLNQPNTGDGYYGLVRNANGTVAQTYRDGALSSPLSRRSAFGKATFEITDTLSMFAQANFAHADVSTYSAGPPPAVGAAWGGAIPNTATGAYNYQTRTDVPAGLQALLASRQLDPDGVNLPLPAGAPGTGATQTWQLNRGLDFLGQFGPTNSSDVYQVMAGVEGVFENRDWTWEAYYSSGTTTATNIYEGLPSVQRWQALVASPNFGAGQTIASAQGGNYQLNCTSGLPIFYGTTSGTSSNCLSSIIGHYKAQTIVSQDILEGNLQGKIIDMRAGELRFAAGATNRRNSFQYEPSNPQSYIYDFPLGLFVSNSSKGESEVSEIYGELLVPVVERLDLELGYRYSDYDGQEDAVGTYKALFNWGATSWMSLRGGYNVANRAPNTAELFQADTLVFDNGALPQGDLCLSNSTAPWANVATNTNRLAVQQLCAALIGNTTSNFGAPGSAQADAYSNVPLFTGLNGNQVGNPNLLPEEAETWTVGLVFRPESLDNFTASVDIYNIKITDAIQTFSASQIYNRCFNYDGVSNPGLDASNDFCQLITRNQSTGAAGVVNQRFLNSGVIETAGIDIGINWGKEIAGGDLYVNTLVSYLDYYDTKITPTDPVSEFKGTLGNGGQYDYRLNSTVGYRFGGGKANVGMRWRYLPEVKNAAYVTVKTTPALPTESYSMFDLFAGYSFNERYQLRAGLDNAFDIDPAVVGALRATSTAVADSNSNSTNTGYYDTLGRRLYVGIKVDF